jgi:hypothetical protein
MTGVSINLHNEEIRDLYYLLNIIRASEAKGMKSTRFCRNGEMRNPYKCYSKSLKEKDYLGNLGVNGSLKQN